MGSTSRTRIAIRPVIAAAATALFVATGAGAATAPNATPPLRTDGQGVSIVNDGGIAFQFGPRAAARYKSIAGHQIALTCGLAATASNGLLTISAVGHPVVKTAPAKRSVLTSGMTDGGDFCAVGLVKPHGKQKLVALVAETHNGALLLNQDEDVRVILSIFFFSGSYIAAEKAAILANIDGVLLNSENSPVPKGKFGLYYRPNHLYLATRDAAGVLLYVRHDGKAVSGNLLGFLSGAELGVYVGETAPLG